ncbi:uncharacterized protein LY89DRAFT_663291 [Mollisia scopiformis]|uniref:2EXR domain-containing protein n=1 Tax=Mollisia scopiformis TaxID=149040 RepID=A0A194XWY0_MOLSC|nr:uncharacterized protein LY89DRAFT_663291 [Mollisia scopiformis]KUJ24564.1 hypothetical protein LY89DRAFT_663291 [Mollisia scopiformis]
MRCGTNHHAFTFDDSDVDSEIHSGPHFQNPSSQEIQETSANPIIEEDLPPKLTSPFHNFNDPKWKVYSKEHWDMLPAGKISDDGSIRTDDVVKPKSVTIEWPKRKLFPASFTMFAQLPPEIRRKIWNDTLPEPRILVLKLRHGSPTYLPIFDDIIGEWPFAGLQHLWACRESWHAFTERYHQIDTFDKYHLQFDASFIRKTAWIDGRRDTLVLDASVLIKRFDIDLSRIQNLAISNEKAFHWFKTSVFAYIRKRCPLLKRFQIVLGRPDEHNWQVSAGDSLRLVRVDDDIKYCEIDSKEELEDDVRFSQYYSAFARESEFLECLRTAEEVHTRFKSHCAANKEWKNIEFQVSLLAVEEDNCNMWYVESVAVMPKPQILIDVSFRVEKPIVPCLDTTLEFLGMEDWDFNVKCDRGGAIHCPYDGIKELFQTDVNNDPIRDLTKTSIKDFGRDGEGDFGAMFSVPEDLD